jgi:hypothetical protein
LSATSHPDDEATVQALCAIEDGLNAWEVEFVESVAEQVIDQGRPLTDAQREKAEKIIEQKGEQAA